MKDEASLPVPHVKELVFTDARRTLEQLSTLGADDSIERSSELNAALINLPIISTTVDLLNAWMGDINELPDIDKLLDLVSEYVALSDNIIRKTYTH